MLIQNRYISVHGILTSIDLWPQITSCQAGTWIRSLSSAWIWIWISEMLFIRSVYVLQIYDSRLFGAIIGNFAWIYGKKIYRKNCSHDWRWDFRVLWKLTATLIDKLWKSHPEFQFFGSWARPISERSSIFSKFQFPGLALDRFLENSSIFG